MYTTPFNSKRFLQTVTSKPGVYRMYDISGIVIYVGKAKNLKKRLASYFIKQVLSPKTKNLIKNIAKIEITITHTETEALLLENNYIKLYQPRYNVLLKDDKTYPYIVLSKDKHPRLTINRGTMKTNGNYFGPFPSAYAVREMLALLKKLFRIRQCENSVYQNRSRPCLQYHINCCLAPCIKGLVTDKDYHQQVEYVRLFLSGQDQNILNQLIEKMDLASQALKFEKAAHYRNQIQLVRKVINQQFIFGNTQNIDFISVAYNLGIACVQVIFIRKGKFWGSRSYYPMVPTNTGLSEVIQTFLGQFYLQGSKIRSLPEEILLDFLLPQKAIFADLLTKIAGYKINIQVQPRGEKAKYLRLAHMNAVEALAIKLAQQSTIHQSMNALANLLGLKKIYRIESFDISHMGGNQTVGSCIVFDSNGPLRSEYRHYNITNIIPGNEYEAIYQILMRRYNKRIHKNKVPDVIILDGGKGQLTQAISVFQKLNVNWDITQPKIISIAKGHNRKVSLDKIFLNQNSKGIFLPYDSLALQLIQNIRNESHNHAIMGHRQRRRKVINTSIVESIKGVGPKRRQLLLKYMGGLQALINANIDEIIKVPGISYVLAKKIYNALKQ